MSIQKSSRSAQFGDGGNAPAALYERSCAGLYGISTERFAEILDEILRKNFPHNASVSPERTADFHAQLHLEELALARACAAGNERAWQDFRSEERRVGKECRS